MFKSKMLIVAPLVLFCIIGASARSCVSVVPQTGQTHSYVDGDDGDLQRGLPWPNPRFTDNDDGTVTDNLTQLIWLKNANCFERRPWSDALNDCNTLEDGDCDLTDGSEEGDWCLPNVRELLSLIHYGVSKPALPAGHPFTGVLSDRYWSSTTYYQASSDVGAWCVGIDVGYVAYGQKTHGFYVWPVRGGSIE